jgi:hypothetical protein
MKAEIRAAADTEYPPDHAPFDFGLLPGGKKRECSANFKVKRRKSARMLSSTAIDHLQIRSRGGFQSD